MPVWPERHGPKPVGTGATPGSEVRPASWPGRQTQDRRSSTTPPRRPHRSHPASHPPRVAAASVARHRMCASPGSLACQGRRCEVRLPAPQRTRCHQSRPGRTRPDGPCHRWQRPKPWPPRSQCRRLLRRKKMSALVVPSRFDDAAQAAPVSATDKTFLRAGCYLWHAHCGRNPLRPMAGMPARPVLGSDGACTACDCMTGALTPPSCRHGHGAPPRHGRAPPPRRGGPQSRGHTGRPGRHHTPTVTRMNVAGIAMAPSRPWFWASANATSCPCSSSRRPFCAAAA